MPGADLAETGSDLNLVVGEIRLVSESIGFSSPTGPQTAQTDPQDPPRTPPGGFENKFYFFAKKNYFFKLSWGGPGGVWRGQEGGLVWVSGGQLGLKSLSIR